MQFPRNSFQVPEDEVEVGVDPGEDVRHALQLAVGEAEGGHADRAPPAAARVAEHEGPAGVAVAHARAAGAGADLGEEENCHNSRGGQISSKTS